MTHTWVGIVAAVVGLGIIVFVHEWGHFIVARLCGVRVLVFSLGYGNRIFGWKRGDTDYRISVFPIGGYVRMAGDNPVEEPTGEPGEFLSKPRWQRFLIIVAGPIMNFVLAIVLTWGLYMVGVKAWPACSAPMVGTRPTALPLLRAKLLAARDQARSSAQVRRICISSGRFPPNRARRRD